MAKVSDFKKNVLNSKNGKLVVDYFHEEMSRIMKATLKDNDNLLRYTEKPRLQLENSVLKSGYAINIVIKSYMKDYDLTYSDLEASVWDYDADQNIDHNYSEWFQRFNQEVHLGQNFGVASELKLTIDRYFVAFHKPYIIDYKYDESDIAKMAHELLN